MPKKPRVAVQPLLPVTFARGGARYAPGVKAGRWVFATGHKGVDDYAGPMAPDVLRNELPGSESPKYRRESDRIFANLQRVLRAGGSDLGNVVRVDQYCSASRAVEFYPTRYGRSSFRRIRRRPR